MQLPLTSPLTELHLADCKALTKLHSEWRQRAGGRRERAGPC